MLLRAHLSDGTLVISVGQKLLDGQIGGRLDSFGRMPVGWLGFTASIIVFASPPVAGQCRRRSRKPRVISQERVHRAVLVFYQQAASEGRRTVVLDFGFRISASDLPDIEKAATHLSKHAVVTPLQQRSYIVSTIEHRLIPLALAWFQTVFCYRLAVHLQYHHAQCRCLEGCPLDAFLYDEVTHKVRNSLRHVAGNPLCLPVCVLRWLPYCRQANSKQEYDKGKSDFSHR